jgi:arabinofuranan 3-O-arabinosyltransferase
MEKVKTPAWGSRSRTEISRVVDEFRSADAATSILWCLVLLIGLFDLYQYYRRGLFGLDFANVLAADRALLHHRTRWGQFDYLPGCLVLVLPLAVLPLRLARPILYVVQFVGVGYALWAVTRITGRSLSSRPIAGLALLLVVAGQVGVVANYENFTLLLVPLAAAFFLCIDRGHTTAAAVVLGISLTVKPLLLPLLVVLLVRRLWRDLTVAVAIPVALSCVALVAIALDGSPDKFVHEVLNTFTSNNSAPVNVSIAGVGHILSLPAGLVDVVRVVVVVACVVVCRQRWLRPIGGPGEEAIWFTAPLLVGMTVCFTFAWAYYAVLLLPLVIVTLDRMDIGARTIQIGVALALLFPVLPEYHGYPDLRASDVLALVGLVMVLVGTALIRPATTVPPTSRPPRADRLSWPLPSGREQAR